MPEPIGGGTGTPSVSTFSEHHRDDYNRVISMSSPIRYQGRQARRSGSEKRRQTILEAALRIIVREGVRAVRHRAVAREADVPLSATTYYFKDITDLIADTFTMFAERAIDDVIEPFRKQAFELLESFDTDSLVQPEKRDQVIASLAEMTTEFVLREVGEQRDHLLAEQAFLQEARLDERLREAARAYVVAQQEPVARACERLATPQPELDAEMLWANIVQLEGRLLLDDAQLDRDGIRRRVHHVLDLLVGKGGQ